LQAWLDAVRPGAVILSGGNDIGECPERDATERFLLSWAQRSALPVLGICRGMQMMAYWAGGTLIPVRQHVRTRHRLTVSTAPDSWPEEVNSFHDWGLADCPPGFEVAARAEDGGIEAMTHASLRWEGWMWHPERESPFAERDLYRLRRLFNE